MRLVSAHSVTRRVVMRKPDSTKKASTPKNPAGRNVRPPW